MGRPALGVPTMPQTGRTVHPTRTVYTFASPTLEVTLTFTTPLLPSDIDVFARPATYLTWELRALDGKTHDATLELGAGGLLATNTGDQTVKGETSRTAGLKDGLTTIKIGSTEQPILGRAGDDLRIDWGYLYLASGVPGTTAKLSADGETRAADLTGTLTIPAGRVGAKAVSRHAIVAYDEVEAIQYFGRNLRSPTGAGTAWTPRASSPPPSATTTA